MAQNDETTEDTIDRQLAVLIKHMNDQFARVLEAVEGSTSKISVLSELLERVEHDVRSIKLATWTIPDDLKLIKICTEKLDDITEELKDQAARLTQLEQAA